jgi:hypothetical protein
MKRPVFALTPCDHVCHKRGLNPWIEECPVCGCENPKYDPEAVSDIEMSETMPLEESLGILLGAMSQPQHESRSWQLMACDRCDYKERLSLSVGAIACPKKCRGVMRPVDGGIARRIAGYEKERSVRHD